MTETNVPANERDGETPDGPSKEPPIESARPRQYSEQWWATVAAPTSKRCTANLSDGSGRCRKPCVPAMQVCTHHGGRAPAAKRKAQQRIAEAADRMARELLKMATDENTPEHVKLRAITEALDRAGVSAKTSVEVEVLAKPWDQVEAAISTQLEVTSRAAHRASVGVEDDQSEVSAALANLAARDRAEAHANADRHRDLADRLRAQHSRDDDGIVDAIVVDAREAAQPFTPADYEHAPDAYGSPVPLSPTRPGGPMDQAVTVEQGNELLAELRARQAQRAHDERRATGHAAIHPARRALPPGRSQK